MRRILTAVAIVALAGATTVAGAGRGAAAEGGGTVEVEVTYQGMPVIEKVGVTRDVEKCSAEAIVEKVAVGANKGLANAVVSLPGVKRASAAKPVLDQQGCRFVPRVVAMAPGETIEIRNSDEMLHAVRTFSTANPPISRAQPKFKKTMAERFEKPEIVKVTCDVHPWTVGWIAVMPGAARVTDPSGLARLDDVPAGRHRLEVWHEVLGKLTRDVEVKAGQTTRVSLEMPKGRER